jgi:streptogramin lyase
MFTILKKALSTIPLFRALLIALFLGSTLLCHSIAFAGVWYVRGDVGISGTGTKWSHALKTIQEAIDAASTGDEIWIKKGTYLLSSQLNVDKAVGIYGGFDGSETQREERDWATNVTTIDGQGSVNHCLYVTSDATIDGLTITGGNADDSDWPDDSGGGIFNDNCSPTITNCHLLDNSAEYGGGIANIKASPIITNCTFTENIALNRGGGIANEQSSPTITKCSFFDNSAGNGGGIYNYKSSPTINGCILERNNAEWEGGGICNHDRSSPKITDCTISFNSAYDFGGGIENVNNSSPTIINCTFFGNSADQDGGGIENFENSSPIITNCTFLGNSAKSHGGGIDNYNNSLPTITNCILWDNIAPYGPEIHDYNSFPTVSHCDIQGGYEGENNINADPLFIDPSYDGFHLMAESPCIDKGNNSAPNLPDTDFEGDPRIIDGNNDGIAKADIGADEYVVADIDKDGLPDDWETHYFGDLQQGADDDYDGDGVSNLEEYQVSTNPTNAYPKADAGPDQTLDEGATVTLNGSHSFDLDDGIATYLWQQISGPPISLSDPATVQSTFTAPGVGPAGASLTFKLTVADNEGQQSTDTMIVSVSNVVADPIISAIAGSGGSISPSGSVKVTKGSDQRFTISPDSGYQAADVLIDGVSHGVITTYTFSDVKNDHTITATFIKVKETYIFQRMWPTLQQPWYFNYPHGITVDTNGLVYVVDTLNHCIQKFTSDGQFVTTWGSYGSGNGDFNEPHGISLDNSGLVYVVDTNNHRIQQFTSDGQFLTKWGSFGSGDGELNAPGGITFDKSGFIYVTDTLNHRIQKFTSDGQFVDTWGSYGSGNGEFNSPFGITFDKSGFIYVTDTLNHRIQKFTSDGQFVGTWGSYGSGNGEFKRPYGIEVDRTGLVFVVDKNNNRIQKFTSDGQFVGKLGSSGDGSGEFYMPCDIAVDSNGLVYVADSGNNRITKFSKELQFLMTWASSGDGNGEFYMPHGIALDSDNSVYVADYHNNRIQKFTSDGQFVTTWGSYGSGNGEFYFPAAIAIDNNGHVYVADSRNNRIQKFTSDGQFVDKWGSYGSGNGEFNEPYGIAVNAAGIIYVADTLNHRIQKFTSDGQFVTTWGSYGSGNGEFNKPTAITFDNIGFVYVVDTHNHRVQKFAPEGKFIATWGSYGSGNGEFNEPSSIATNSDNFIYVTDNINHRIQKFNTEGKFITTWGSPGSNPGQFAKLVGLCISAEGSIYVTDKTYNRIQVFKKETTHVNNKAIIVAGGGPYPGNNIWEETEMCANYAYRALTYQGFTNDTIYYLSSNTDLDLDQNGIADVDADATNSNLTYAITDWAQDAENLFMYMVDHGGNGIFRMSAHELLEAEDLDTSLDTLQEHIPGNVTLFYDACMSGSFLPILDPPSGKERIIITSTSKDEPANIASQGRVSFGWFFWGNMLNGDSFYDSFVLATSSIGHTFHTQHPLLEGNGNGIGNEKEDKDIARALKIVNETKSAGDIPTIGSVSPAQILDGETSALIYADNVIDPNGISRVWAVITPPGYSSGSPDKPIKDFPTFDLTLVEGDRHEGTYNDFISGGTYHIAIFASDKVGTLSLPKATTVTVANGYPDGDVAPLGSRDGKVNVGDALVALRFALGLEHPSPEDTVHGDVAPLDSENKPNPDGVINVGDALVILRKALGIIWF